MCIRDRSYPVIDTLGPNQRFEFKSHFWCIGQQTKIKLGFHLQRTTGYIDLMQTNLDDIKNWLLSEEQVIWANEKNIE